MLDLFNSLTLEEKISGISLAISFFALLIAVLQMFYTGREVDFLRREFEASKYPVVEIELGFIPSQNKQLDRWELFFTVDIEHFGGPATMSLKDIEFSIFLILPHKRWPFWLPRTRLYATRRDEKVPAGQTRTLLLDAETPIEDFLELHLPEFMEEVRQLKPSDDTDNDSLYSRPLTWLLETTYTPAVTGARLQKKSTTSQLQAYYDNPAKSSNREVRWRKKKEG